MFYSKSTNGFYAREIHGDSIPADAVEITADQHVALLNGQSEGKRIVADENGFPVLEDMPVAPWSAEPTLARVREAREVVLNRIAGIAMAAMVASDQTTVDACLAARTALLGITTVPAVKAATDDASLATALETAYVAIVSGAPANVRPAFRDFRV